MVWGACAESGRQTTFGKFLAEKLLLITALASAYKPKRFGGKKRLKRD